MASSRQTKLRIAGSVLFATGFFDALAGRFLYQPLVNRRSAAPDSPAPNNPSSDYIPLRGAIHVHSTYSDGGGDIPTVMAGACAANVDFVLLTDHNSQRPLRDGWEEHYNDRPLLLIGTEITVEHGAFLLALDMPPDWEPTKHQEPQVAIDEVNAHGGIPLISLPFDVKHPWREWNVTGCAGLEVINLSTVARRHINIPSLLWLVPIGRLSGVRAALRALLTRPDAALERWDMLTASGTPSVGIAALDAHALMKIGKKKYPIPSYADSLGVVTTHVLIPRDAQASPQATRQAIYAAVRQGHCFLVYDALGVPERLSFSAQAGTLSAITGDCITACRQGVTLQAECRSDNGTATLLCLYHHGRVIAAATGGSVSVVVTESGAYRLEVYQYRAQIGPFFLGVRPWAFSNPIYVQASRGDSGKRLSGASTDQRIF